MFASLRGHRSEWLRGDLIAGLTVWAVLVPESLAHASIAGGRLYPAVEAAVTRAR